MLNEYVHIIQAGEQLLEEVTGHKWEHGTTGGGCDAFFLNLHDEKNSYFMVTHSEGACIPESPEEWEQITMGLYDDNNDSGDYFDIVTGTDSLRIFFHIFNGMVD